MVHPSCEEYNSSVWAMCYGQPFKKWGCGPGDEGGCQTSLNDCNYDYQNSAGGNYGVGCPEQVHPTCEEYEGSVWAMCNGEPFKEYGCGPGDEGGCQTSLSNCNYSYENPAGNNYGVGCPGPHLSLAPAPAPYWHTKKVAL